MQDAEKTARAYGADGCVPANIEILTATRSASNLRPHGCRDALVAPFPALRSFHRGEGAAKGHRFPAAAAFAGVTLVLIIYVRHTLKNSCFLVYL